MVNFMTVLDQWESFGVFNVLLPFLLVFAITFAILEKIQLFGQKRQINGIIAAIMGILLVRNQYVVGIINRFLPNVSLFMVVILMFLLLLGIFVGKSFGWTDNMLGVAVIISLVFVVWSLSSDFLGERFELPDFLTSFDEQTKSSIFMIAIFVAVIYFVTKDSSGKGIWSTLGDVGGQVKGNPPTGGTT
jgi:hypothetical protein